MKKVYCVWVPSLFSGRQYQFDTLNAREMFVLGLRQHNASFVVYDIVEKQGEL